MSGRPFGRIPRDGANRDEATGGAYHARVGVEAVPVHGVAVSAAVGGSGYACAVDVGDPVVTEADEVVDGLVQPFAVGGAALSTPMRF